MMRSPTLPFLDLIGFQNSSSTTRRWRERLEIPGRHGSGAASPAFPDPSAPSLAPSDRIIDLTPEADAEGGFPEGHVDAATAVLAAPPGRTPTVATPMSPRAAEERRSPRREAPELARTVVIGTTGFAVVSAATLSTDAGSHWLAVVAPIASVAGVPTALYLGWTLRGLSRGSDRTCPPSPGVKGRRRSEAENSTASWPEVPARNVSDGRDLRRGGRDMDRLRRHARIRPQRTSVIVATDDSRRLTARVIDLSQSGVALEGTMPGIWIGEMITVGTRRSKAVRLLPSGIVLEFSVPIPADVFDARFIL